MNLVNLRSYKWRSRLLSECRRVLLMNRLAMEKVLTGYYARQKEGPRPEELIDLAKETALAKAGDVHAMVRLGIYYLDDDQKDHDEKKAVDWLGQAALLGNENAQCLLGDCYENGYGVKKSIRNAIKWYKKAADQGMLDAYEDTGRCYLIGGDDMPADPSKAVPLLIKAVECGSVHALMMLSLCYLWGMGIARDVQQGLKLLIVAMEGQDEAAAQILLQLLA